MMNNRVDYLSDKLVNLRGRLKNVEEVVPRDSIVNGVSVPAAGKNSVENKVDAASARAVQAVERRREQTCQLFADYEQRVAKRSRQLEVKAEKLAGQLEEVKALQQQLNDRRDNLNKLRISEEDVLSQVELGERFRTIDRERLAFYAFDGEIELLLNENNSSADKSEAAPLQEESFKNMLKKGWALALSLGLVIGVSAIIAALIVYMGWR